MLIIVEGQDGVGKSTFVRRLVEEISYDPNVTGHITVLHAKAPQTDAVYEYTQPLNQYRPKQPAFARQHVICDRWHIGELVYPAVFHRPTTMTPQVRTMIELYLDALGAVLVWLTDTPENIVERVAERGDDLVEPDMIHDLHVRYQKVVFGSLLNLQIIEGLPTTHHVRHVVSMAARRERDLPGRNTDYTRSPFTHGIWMGV